MKEKNIKKNLRILAHLSHWLMVSYCDRWMSVVRPVSSIMRRVLSTIASKEISS